MKFILILRFLLWDFPRFIIMKWIEVYKWEKELTQFEKEMRKKWLEDLEAFAKQRRKYHHRRAKTNPEEYPDYRRKK